MKSKIKASVLAALMLLFMFSPCFAAHIRAVKILDYGVYEVKKGRTEHDVLSENSATSITKVKKAKLLAGTKFIPCKKGVLFGMRYRVDGGPQGAKFYLVIRVAHPEMRVPGKGVRTMTRWEETPEAGEINFVGLMFQKKWSQKPGEYVIEVVHRDKVLARQKFHVIKLPGD